MKHLFTGLLFCAALVFSGCAHNVKAPSTPLTPRAKMVQLVDIMAASNQAFSAELVQLKRQGLYTQEQLRPLGLYSLHVAQFCDAAHTILANKTLTPAAQATQLSIAAAAVASQHVIGSDDKLAAQVKALEQSFAALQMQIVALGGAN